jgi:negative regulator of sigma E activity
MELLTDELIELHDKHRLGTMTPADLEKLATLLKDPGRKAAWDELERISASYKDVPSGKLPKDFTANVMQSIRALSAAKAGRPGAPAPVAEVKPAPKRENPWRRPLVWGPAATAVAAAAVIGRLSIAVVQPPMGNPQTVTYDCRPESATAEGQPVPLTEIAHHQPAKIVIEGGEIAPNVAQPAPEALLCGDRQPTGCVRWSPLPNTVINYACLKR